MKYLFIYEIKGENKVEKDNQENEKEIEPE